MSDTDYSAFDKVPIGLVVCGEGLTVRFWNACMEDWTGIGRADVVGQGLQAFFPRFSEDRFKARLQLVMEGGPPAIFSYQLNGCLFPHRNEGRIGRAQHLTVSFLGQESDGERQILFAIEDRTEVSSRIKAARAELSMRMEVEKDLRSYLKEREFLLKELNHRIKNDFTMVLSILELQKATMQEGYATGFLDDAIARIGAFAHLHETLHLSGRYGSVELADYLDDVAQDLFESVTNPGWHCSLNVDLAPVKVPVRTALYLGLAVNEALTNAVKYGIAPNRAGQVLVSLTIARRGTDDFGSLSIQDDGPGFPVHFEEKTGDSLGIRLLCTVAADLKGTVSFGTCPGGKVTIDFPLRGKDSDLDLQRMECVGSSNTDI